MKSAETWGEKVAALRARLGREPNLDELLTLCRGHQMTAEEIEAQRRSYARAGMGFGTDADEAVYAAAVLRGDRKEIERLDQAARDRMSGLAPQTGKRSP